MLTNIQLREGLLEQAGLPGRGIEPERKARIVNRIARHRTKSRRLRRLTIACWSLQIVCMAVTIAVRLRLPGPETAEIKTYAILDQNLWNSYSYLQHASYALLIAASLFLLWFHLVKREARI